MKGFVAALILAAVLLGGITGNYIYINRVADRMNERLEKLPDVTNDACVTAVKELLEYWGAHADTVCLSVAFNTVDRVNEQATTLLACAECGDVYGYQTALALLRDSIGDMRRLEAFSIGNLL